MPATQPPVIGVPFVVAVVSNKDGSTVTITATVLDAQGRFTASANNTGTEPATLRLLNPEVVFAVAPGVTELPIPNGRRWSDTPISIQSA